MFIHINKMSWGNVQHIRTVLLPIGSKCVLNSNDCFLSIPTRLSVYYTIHYNIIMLPNDFKAELLTM